MGLRNGAVYLLLLVLSVHGDHEPPKGTPSFVRTAVESPPQIKDLSSLKVISPEFSKRPTFGDVFLPLRSAVETVPSISPVSFTVTSKTFIRDSVEYRPSHNKLQDSGYLDEPLTDESHPYAVYVEEPSHALGSEKYAAFIIPSTYDDRYPQPFRFGSPYQQIVEAPKPVENKNNIKTFVDANVKQSLRKDLTEHPKVLCYITNWAFHRKNDGKFVPENLDSGLCTTVIYSFASLDPKTLMIKEFDPWVDVENELYRRTTSLKVPVLLALGGWTDSTGDKYSRLVSNPTARKAFASNLVTFLSRYGFRGLHLDWNYPKCWQSDCRKGPASDKTNFAKLIQDIRTEFDRIDHTMQLGVAISGYKEVITDAYDLEHLSKVATYLTVMSYDYHGAWEHQTGHVSPLYGRPNDKYPQYNTDFTMSLLINNGAAREKLIMGIPFYGQTFTLTNSHNSLVGEGVSAAGPGEPGEFTKQPGMLAYYEICQRIRKGKWLVGRDPTHKSGPHATIRNQWVGYEDPASVELKARYAVNNGYGGVAAWTVDLDDFQNRCCGESFPLLKAINRALGRLSSPPPIGLNCERPPDPVTPIPPVMTTVGDNGLPMHEQTTWPSWKPSTSVKPQVTTAIISSQKPTSTIATTTIPAKPSTTSSPVWWQPESTTSKPTVWWQPPTTTSTTTLRPTTTVPRRTTSTTMSPLETTTIPVPAVVMPVVILDDVKCEAIQFMADPNNCNSYYQCVYTEMRQQHCPGGLHWNAQSNNCDWPAAANCEPIKRVETTTVAPSRPTKTTARTTPTTRTSTTRTPSTQAPTKPVPPRQTSLKPRPTSAAFNTCENGMYYPHADCESFNICVNNKLIQQHCGSDLQWNIALNSCDWANNVRCISKKNYLKLIQARSAISDPCEGSSYVPYPGDCTQYMICNWNRLEASECPPGLHWNQNQQNCDWPANANCDDSSVNLPPLSGVGEDNNGISLPSTTWRPSYAPTLGTPTTTRRPTFPTDRPNLQPLSGYYKVVCYFTNWAWYRKGIGRYTPDNINTDLCTHIVYGFAVLDYTELTIRTHDSWADIDNRFYERVTELKNKGVKVSLALGGWNDSQGDKYSRLVRSAQSRAKFVKHALQFLEKYGFEGLDLDWEYPVCWQTECNKGFPDEREGFTELVRELSSVLKPRGLLLSTAVSPSKKIIDAGYNVPELARLFDWIAVMTYDFHGQWDKKTGHVAPLYYHPNDDYEYFNTNFSINYWIEKGAPSRKIVLGMPLYGQSFSLSDVKTNGLNSHAPGPGRAGEFTRAAGFLAYYEICDRVKNHGWNVVTDLKGRMGPYAYKDNQWVSYDDPDTLRRKSQLVRSLNLGGGMVWALDLDDFRNRCGDGVHPLLTTIHNVLKDPPSAYEKPPLEWSSGNEDTSQSESHEPESSGNPEVIPVNIETLPDNSESEVIAVDPNTQVEENELIMNSVDNTDLMSDDFKVICYFTNWAWYRQSGGKYIPEDIDPNLCTHIVYGFAVLDRDHLEIKPHDSWADLDNKFYERVITFKKRGIKVTVAIGGWNDSAGDKYARLVRSQIARAKFIKHVTEFILKHGFDGLDLDWEYPVCWQVDCNKGHPDEKEGFSELVRELSEEFKPRGLLLSTAVSPNKKVIDAGYDVPKLSKYFDWIAVMTYDYHGQWDKKTGHVAPMYDTPDDDPTFNANFSINYWLELGADRKKIIMGMPMYGQSFSLAENTRNTLHSPTYGGGEAGEATRARGFLSYYEICTNIRNKGWKVVRDRRGRIGPYAYLRDQWVSFDDANMIRHKSEYIRAMEIGGAMIWALDLDDFKNDCDCETYPLLKTINRVLRNYPGPHARCKLEDRTELAPDDKIKEDYISTSKPPSSSTWWTPSSTTTTERSELDEKPFELTNNNPISNGNIDCNNRNFAPHQNDCNKFYICQFGTFVVQSCPAGLYWNNGHCDWPQNTNCKVTEEIITSSIQPTDSGDERPIEKPTKKPFENVSKKPTMISKPDPPKPAVVHREEKFKVVCYFTNWAWYRSDEGKYTPDNIDENLCTHIVYGFAVLNGETLTIKTHDSWADIDNKFYERVTDLRKKGIKVTLAIGGWNDSLGDKYSRLVRNPQARARFIKHVIEFLGKYNFEGLDLDWEYPVCWQVDCEKGNPDEKEAFASFVRELSIEFRPRNLLLSAAVSPSKMVIDTGYDVPVLARYFDWIAVMTYDFHGHWDKQTGHVAPLYYVPGDNYDYFNGNFSINYWIEKGTPPEKLIMGMPLYGQSFSLTDVSQRGLNQRTTGPGQAGRFTKSAGFLAYYEICEKVNQGDWTVVRDAEGRIGPYAYHGSQWVSYDDVTEIRRKSQFVKQMGLGGGMVWALDLDDFRGRCGCGKHPLLRTLNQELRGTPGQRASDCT